MARDRRYNKKKRGAKKTFNRKIRKYYKKNVITNDKVTLYPMRNKIVPLPSLIRIKITVSNYGNSGQGGTTGDLRFYFPLNNPVLPFAGTVVGAGGFTWNGNTAATQMPGGLTQLFNPNLYTTCRVLGSKITVNVNPESVTDPVLVVITPSAGNNNPLNAGLALNQPFAKRMQFAAGKGSQKGFSNYITQAQFFGVDRKAIEYDLSGNFTTTVSGGPPAYTLPGKQLFWQVNLETLDNNIFAAAVNVNFSITYYLEFYGMVTATISQ